MADFIINGNITPFAANQYISGIWVGSPADGHLVGVEGNRFVAIRIANATYNTTNNTLTITASGSANILPADSLGEADIATGDKLLIYDETADAFRQMDYGALAARVASDEVEDWSLDGNTDNIPASKQTGFTSANGYTFTYDSDNNEYKLSGVKYLAAVPTGSALDDWDENNIFVTADGLYRVTDTGGTKGTTRVLGTGGGSSITISASNPEPIDNAPSAGSSGEASDAAHKHRFNISGQGDVRASWNNEEATFNLENTRLRDWGADLAGDGYTLVPGAVTQTSWTTEPTLAQLAAADTGDYWQIDARYTDRWVGISIDSTDPLSDAAELRVGASDDGSILFVHEQTNILRAKFTTFTSKGSTGGRSYFTYRVPDLPLGDYVTVVQRRPLTVRTDPQYVIFDPPFAHVSHLPELVTTLPFEPIVGTTRRIAGVVSYPVTVEGTVSAPASGELLIQFADQVVNGLTLAQINAYASDYAGTLSSLRAGRVFAQFIETNNAVANASVYIDGTAHAITATYLDQQSSSKEHEVPTLNYSDFADGQTVRLQFIRGNDQSPANRSIGHTGQTITVEYAGNDQWNWSGSAPLDAQGRIQFTFLGVRLTQAEYDALSPVDANTVYYVSG